VNVKMVEKTSYERWIYSAENMLQLAKNDMENGAYVWSYYKSRRAAEYALKGLLRGMGITGCNDGPLAQLLSRLGQEGVEIPEELNGCARDLDKYYTMPGDSVTFESEDDQFIDSATAGGAIKQANKVIGFAGQFREAL